METNRYLVKVNDNEEAFKLLKKMKAKSNIRWASGDELDDEDILDAIYNVDDDVSYLVIKDNDVYWLDEDDYFQAPEEFSLFDLYDVNSFIEKVVDNMKKKLEVKDLAVIASDDKYGEKLLNFLDEFTAVKFNSGDTLTSKAMADLIKEYKYMHPENNLIFVIINNRMYTDIYYEGDFLVYKTLLKCDRIYNSVREFLLCKDEWIIE